MRTDQSRIALLIDADNAPAAKIDDILAEVARHGTANVRRAYGNWKSPHLQSWEAQLHPYAIRPMQQFAYSTGKNASDMAMVIDAMDLLHSGSVNAFAIVSSDADFTPLVMRLLADGAQVFGFGQQQTPEPFRSACSIFTFVEALGQVTAEATEAGPTVARSSRQKLRGDTRLVSLLRSAAQATADDDGWAPLANVGQHISNQGSFDHRNHGYAKLSELIKATDLFDMKRRNQVVWVRDKRLAS